MNYKSISFKTIKNNKIDNGDNNTYNINNSKIDTFNININQKSNKDEKSISSYLNQYKKLKKSKDDIIDNNNKKKVIQNYNENNFSNEDENEETLKEYNNSNIFKIEYEDL